MYRLRLLSEILGFASLQGRKRTWKRACKLEHVWDPDSRHLCVTAAATTAPLEYLASLRRASRIRFLLGSGDGAGWQRKAHLKALTNHITSHT